MIALKFTIDIRLDLWYSCACYLEQTSLSGSSTFPISLNLSVACRLLKSLASLFPTAVPCFQQLPASFREIPRVEYLCDDSASSASQHYHLPLPFAALEALQYLPLESTLTKVYQNKQLQVPLESTLVKNRGRGGIIVNQI